MHDPVTWSSHKTGTVGGILTVLVANLNSGDLLKTAVQASIGAAVSFVVSWLLKTWMQRRKK